MEHDLMDIFEPENDEVEQAIKALEEAAFSVKPEEEKQVEIPKEESAEQETEQPGEMEQEDEEANPEEKEESSAEPEPETEKPESEPEEESEPESPEPEEDAEPESEETAATVEKTKLQLVLGRIRTLAETDKKFTAAVVAALAILAVLVIAIALLPGKQGGDTVSGQEMQVSEEAMEDTAPTLYITRIDKPGAPEKEYVPVAGTEVVEKTPLFWGIDVSEHQQEIDWQTVSSTGVDFAMIRAGYRGYTEGQVYADEYFKANMRGALNAGLDVGVYFFSQATSVEEAVDEAKFVLKMVKGWDITYPIVFDWEFIENSTARTYSMTAEEVTDCAMAFCEAIAYAGYTPMIYFGQNTSITHFDLERLMVFDFWLADYTDTPVFPFDFQMWQYTSSGSIDGIVGDVDVNYCFTEYKTTEASQ